jgi:hypothetical protein
MSLSGAGVKIRVLRYFVNLEFVITILGSLPRTKIQESRVKKIEKGFKKNISVFVAKK